MTLKERASQYVEQAALSLEQAGKDLATLAKAQPLKEREFISVYEKAYYLVRALRAFSTRVSGLPETQQTLNRESMTPQQFIKSASQAGVFVHPRVSNAISWASDIYMEYILKNELTDDEASDAANNLARSAMEKFGLDDDESQEYIVTALYNLKHLRTEESMQNKESINEDAMRLVNTLLDEQGGQAELEINTVEVDSMPHTAWMLRAVGTEPTAYLAKDIAHTHEIAMRAAQDKARLLGVQITRVIDNSTGGRA